MAASLSLVTLVPLANGWPPQPPSWQKYPLFGEKELGSALLGLGRASSQGSVGSRDQRPPPRQAGDVVSNLWALKIII